MTPVAHALPLLSPAWNAPAGVRAAMSTRQGGVSIGPWASLNVSGSVGDDACAVAENRRRFEQALGAPLVGLHLVHGAEVIRLSPQHLLDQQAGRPRPVADAAWTDEPHLACAVTAADCLPVLLCCADGRAVAAAHAGWRGLAAGVLENTVAALVAGTGCPAADLLAWLGPCIGPAAFEVGAEVRQAFADGPHPPGRFVPGLPRDGSPRWWADLLALARDRLTAAGVQHISGDGRCTVAETSSFFSYRRDRVTGRMVAAIWRA